MASKSPVFPIPEPQHFSDYGFDPQIDYFQVLEEARKHQRENPVIDSIHFRLRKPNEPKTPKRKPWWKSAWLFFKWTWVSKSRNDDTRGEDVHQARARAFRASVSGPVYVTESKSGSTTPRRTTSSGPLKGGAGTPYLSLRELNMHQQQRMSPSSVPLYFVT